MFVLKKSGVQNLINLIFLKIEIQLFKSWNQNKTKQNRSCLVRFPKFNLGYLMFYYYITKIFFSQNLGLTDTFLKPGSKKFCFLSTWTSIFKILFSSSFPIISFFRCSFSKINYFFKLAWNSFFFVFIKPKIFKIFHPIHCWF